MSQLAFEPQFENMSTKKIIFRPKNSSYKNSIILHKLLILDDIFALSRNIHCYLKDIIMVGAKSNTFPTVRESDTKKGSQPKMADSLKSLLAEVHGNRTHLPGY